MAEGTNIDVESLNSDLDKLNSIDELDSFSTRIYDLLADENTPDNLTEKLQEIISKATKKRDETQKETSDSNKEQKAEEMAVVPNDEAHSKFLNAKSNEERRQIALQEFQNGEFTHKEHKDFFIEQFAKGEIVIDKQNNDMCQKLENVLGGKEGIQERKENLLKSVVSSSLNTYTTTNRAMAPVIGKDDFGLSVAKDDVLKKGNKTDFDECMAEVERLALLKKELGNDRKEEVARREEELRKNLEEFKSGEKKLKWYQFRRQQKLNKVDEKLDPIGYWHEQRQSNGGSLYVLYMHGRATRRVNNAKEYKEKLNSVIDAKAVDASTKWFSKRIGEKIKAKKTVLFSRSPEKLLEKFQQNATTADMAQYQEELRKNLESKKESYNTGILTKNQQAEHKKYTEYYGDFAEKLDKAAEQKRSDVAKLEEGITGAQYLSDKPEMVAGNLKSKLEQVKRSFEQAKKDDIVLKAWNNFHDANSNEAGKFSDMQILQIICEQSGFENIDGLLRSMGIPENKVSELKDQILGEQKNKTPTGQNLTEEKPQQEEQSVNAQTDPAKVTAVKNAPEGKEPIANTAFYQSGENEYVYNKQVVSVGGNPLASKEEQIRALLNNLKSQGVKDIEITGFDDDMANTFNDVLKSDEFKNDFNVTNKEEFDKQVEKVKTDKQNVDGNGNGNDNNNPEIGDEATEKGTLENMVLGQSDGKKDATDTSQEENDTEGRKEEISTKDKDELMLDIIKKHKKGEINDYEMTARMKLVLSTGEISKGMAIDKDSDYSKKMKKIDNSELDKDEKQSLKDIVTVGNLYDEVSNSIEGIKEVNEVVATPAQNKSIEAVQKVAALFSNDIVAEDNDDFKKLSPDEQQMVIDICNIRKETRTAAEKEFKGDDDKANKIEKARKAAEILVVKDAITKKFASGRTTTNKDRNHALSKTAINLAMQSKDNSK